MSVKRIVIFGCGYVGRGVARAAVEAGHEVWIQSRNGDSLAAVVEVPAERHIVGNLHDSEWHKKLSGDWDGVFNLVSSAGGGLDGYRLSYVEGNRSIREWARGVSVGRFIYTSATSVYPQADGAWVSEDDVPDIAKLSPSGQVLFEAETEIREAAVFPERVIARLAGIYGPGRHLYLNRIKEGAPSLPGDGSGWLNLIYLPDIVDVLLRLLDVKMHGASEVVNVVDDAPTRKQEIVDWLAAELGQASIPFNPADGGARATRRQTSGGLPNRRVSNARLKALLGWSPAFPDYKAGYRDIFSAG